MKRNAKAFRALRQRREAAREFSQNNSMVEEIFRTRLEQQRTDSTEEIMKEEITMFLEDVGIHKVRMPGDIAEAILAADSGTPGVVCIPADYLGVDAAANPAGVKIWDLRSPSQNPAWMDSSSAVIARIALAGVAANVAATNFLAVTPPAGVYRVSVYLVNTTAFTTSGILATIGYTDSKQAQAQPTVATGTTAGSDVQAEFIFQSSGAAQITYALSSTGTYGAASAYLVLERLS
jgi:hypothetical protein